MSSSLSLALIAAVAFMLQGYDQAVFNGLVSLESFVKKFPQIDTLNTDGATKHHNSRIQGTTVAIYEVGCAIGALSCWFLGNKLGRKKTVQLMGIIVIIGTAIQASAFSLGQLIFARVFTGLGVGGYTATIPMWISECAPASLRGPLVLICAGFAISGIALANWINLGMYYIHNTEFNWRFPIAFQGLFPIIVTVLVPLLPESPRWLANKGRLAESRTVLLRLRKNNDAIVDAEMAEIEQALFKESQIQDKSPFSRNKQKQLQRTIMAIAINALAQLSGVNVVTFFSTSIFQQQLHYDAEVSRIFSASMQTWQALWAWSSVLFAMRFGRRTLMLAASAIFVVTLACLAGLVSAAETNLTAAKASIAFDFVALAAFPVGMFLIPMMYAAEISNLAVRHKVTAMASCSNWLFNFLVAEITPIAFEDIAWKYYLVYMSINVMTCVVVFLFYPETRGRTLEEMDVIFEQSSHPLDTVRVAKNFSSTVAFYRTDTQGSSSSKKFDEQRVEHAQQTIAVSEKPDNALPL